MKSKPLQIIAAVASEKMPDYTLSFIPYIRYLLERKEALEGSNKNFYSYLLDQFKDISRFSETINLNNLERYENCFQLIYESITPVLHSEKNRLWALSIPGELAPFYGTDSLYDLVSNHQQLNQETDLQLEHRKELSQLRSGFNYVIILQKCYNIQTVLKWEPIVSRRNKLGLWQHYKIIVDAKFIDVHKKMKLPDLQLDYMLNKRYDDQQILSHLQQLLPMDKFHFDGFGLIQAKDVTVEHTLELIRNNVFDHSIAVKSKDYAEIFNLLKDLIQVRDIEIGLLPILYVNEKLVSDDRNILQSIFLKTFEKENITEAFYLSLIEDYLNDPGVIFFKELSLEDENRHLFVKLLKEAGIKSYASLPVFYNSKVVGIIELSTKIPNLLTEETFAQLEPANLLLAQLAKHYIDDFSKEISNLISKRFTAIQPSVQWRFNEVAWKHLKTNFSQDDHQEMTEIEFENVHPFYGAIDIRNSTIERHTALVRDLSLQIDALLNMFGKLPIRLITSFVTDKISDIQSWSQKIKNNNGFDIENEFNELLPNKIYPFLQKLVSKHPECSEIVTEFNSDMENIAHANRNQLELAMKSVISYIDKELNQMNENIQKIHPIYYEQFRTDGIEYDVYAGQSIAPDLPFNKVSIKTIQKLQLSTMISISRGTYCMAKEFSYPVETTQLIYVPRMPISIKFRREEKRFDVEGPDNVRYHMIKKRIDKACIKGTKERLTQPNKIAIVYFYQEEIIDYINYINDLVAQGLLKAGIEYLELENFPGLSLLKALRVEVKLVDRQFL